MASQRVKQILETEQQPLHNTLLNVTSVFEAYIGPWDLGEGWTPPMIRSCRPLQVMLRHLWIQGKWSQLFFQYVTLFHVSVTLSSSYYYECVCVRTCSGMSDSATPWTVDRQVSLSMEFPRKEYWSGLSFPIPGDVPNPGIKPMSPVSPALAGEFFTTESTGKS